MPAPEYGGVWPQLRLEILERDGRVCQIASPYCKRVAVEVDHIIPVSEGGSWRDPANLRAVCRPCHNTRQSRTLVVVSSDFAPRFDW